MLPNFLPYTYEKQHNLQVCRLVIDYFLKDNDNYTNIDNFFKGQASKEEIDFNKMPLFDIIELYNNFVKSLLELILGFWEVVEDKNNREIEDSDPNGVTIIRGFLNLDKTFNSFKTSGRGEEDSKYQLKFYINFPNLYF